MTIVTRTRLDRCATRGCPWPLDEDIHRPWCLAIPGVQHTREAQHQHVPKRSQGGKTVAAILCAYCHDRTDNTPVWENKVIEFDDGERRYRLWDTKTGEILIDRELGASSDGGESGRSPGKEAAAESQRDDSLPSPDVSASERENGGGSDGGVTPDDPASDDPPLSPNLADDAGRDSRGGSSHESSTVAVTLPTSERGGDGRPSRVAVAAPISEQEENDGQLGVNKRRQHNQRVDDELRDAHEASGESVHAGIPSRLLSNRVRDNRISDTGDDVAPTIAESLKPNGPRPAGRVHVLRLDRAGEDGYGHEPQ